MGNLKYYYIFALLGVFIFVGFLLYLFLVRTPGLTGLNDITSGIRTAEIKKEDTSPGVSLEKKGENSLLIKCKNIPAGAVDIEIFRSRISETQWVLWKTQKIFPGCDTEVIEIKIIEEEPFSYKYYFKAVSGSGEELWVSGIVYPGEPPSSPNIPPPASSGPGSPGPEVPPPSQPAVPPPATPSSSASEPPPSSPGGGNATGTPTSSGETYYTPSGIISGSSTGQQADFWVQHVNQRIEIGWQNLSADTDKLSIYRSLSSTGPWEKLLDLNDPALYEASYIRLVDNTLDQDYYYRMDALDSGQVFKTYGPLLLNHLQ